MRAGALLESELRCYNALDTPVVIYHAKSFADEDFQNLGLAMELIFCNTAYLAIRGEPNMASAITNFSRAPMARYTESRRQQVQVVMKVRVN